MNRNKICGFTLMELMIAVAIVGILAAIAYPSYQEQVRKSKRSDAKTALLDAAQRLERCYTQFNAYNSTSCSALVNGSGNFIAQNSPEGQYSITTTGTFNATQYTLLASPVTGGSQVGDTKCNKFTLTHTGVKGLQNSSQTVSYCW